MLLKEINLDLPDRTPSKEIKDFLKEAYRRTEKFYDDGLGLRYPKYIQSDPAIVQTAIQELLESERLEGNVFCEWGCGFGIAAGIANLLGMASYGIEIEEDLATSAIRLASDLKLSTTILQTSYLPDGFDESEGHGGKDLIAPENTSVVSGTITTPEYDGLDPADVDLFFVYPWPDQEEMMMDLFHAVAIPEAILLMYLGDGEIAAYENEAE